MPAYVQHVVKLRLHMRACGKEYNMGGMLALSSSFHTSADGATAGGMRMIESYQIPIAFFHKFTARPLSFSRRGLAAHKYIVLVFLAPCSILFILVGG